MFGKKEIFKLDKLKEGFTFKLKKAIWRISEIAEYDWNGDGRSIEYILKSEKSEEAFLEVEVLKGDYEIYFSKAISLDDYILRDAINTEEVIVFNDQFFLEEHYKGAYKNLTNRGSWENLKSYMFYNKSDDVLTIEDWGDGKYEVFYGEEIKTKSIKKITPN
ncbi:hypothetical protein A8C32_11765 [Flavivirga aquatica]|uniref:DUF4178 domain-containing protein n=1 Tax=Flavivirga aquatica TaxID=1849968 RepID=A0A1E5TDG2_9FLAO|nr:DUF4178 domain-containing protein [Flavivirga aquatica]OEK09389.1 hypothetical protein A8C32_11765 [Flavivirga aquatica]